MFAYVLGVGGHFIQHGEDAGGNVEFTLVFFRIRFSQAKQHPFALDLKVFFKTGGHVVSRVLLAPVGEGGAGADVYKRQQVVLKKSAMNDRLTGLAYFVNPATMAAYSVFLGCCLLKMCIRDRP